MLLSGYTAAVQRNLPVSPLQGKGDVGWLEQQRSVRVPIRAAIRVTGALPCPIVRL